MSLDPNDPRFAGALRELIQRELGPLANLVRDLQGRLRVVEGDPENAVAAPVGTIAVRRDGSPGASLYVKESGGDGDTGWAAK